LFGQSKDQTGDLTKIDYINERMTLLYVITLGNTTSYNNKGMIALTKEGLGWRSVTMPL
jgi:hypothetical protein